MVLFHIDLAGPANATNEIRVDLPHKIPSQVLRLTKSIVHVDTSNPNTEHVVYVELPFLSGYELTNNNSHSWLPISCDPAATRTESDYDIRVKAEEVPQSFTVRVFKDAAGTPFNLQSATPGNIDSLQLFFEYGTNQTFH